MNYEPLIGLLEQETTLEQSLKKFCDIVSSSFDNGEIIYTRVMFDGRACTSARFVHTPHVCRKRFRTPNNKRGALELFVPTPQKNTSSHSLQQLTAFLVTLISRHQLARLYDRNPDTFNGQRPPMQRLLFENTERVKELKAINRTSAIVNEGRPVKETLQAVCAILPDSLQYPELAAARIIFEGRSYTTTGFMETEWSLKERFVTVDSKKGQIEFFYLTRLPRADIGPFLKEEKDMLLNITRLVCGFLNGYTAHGIVAHKGMLTSDPHRSEAFRESLVRNKKPLQLYFNQQTIDKYIYLDMMKYKIRHILFIATLYDAFMLESEDAFFEKFMGEIYQYSLFSVPRITWVSTADEALELMQSTGFDLVIVMAGIDREAPLVISDRIRAVNVSVPVYLLLNRKSDVNYFEEVVPHVNSVDKLFVWNGNSQILFAMVKSTEDAANVENDTRIGLVRVILLVEDSSIYYSRYLQILYDIIFGQVQRVLPEVEKNEIDKICKMRSRPKVLHARNYEEAVFFFNKYKDFMLCVISDIEFERKGRHDKHAGVRLIKYVQSQISKLPVILQSSDDGNAMLAAPLNATFINKNSETLLNEVKAALKNYLGFGNFVFRGKDPNKVIAVAKSLREFETLLHEIPDESLYLHSLENQFSLWLMARGEIQLARTLNAVHITSFDSMDESRQFVIDQIRRYKEEKKKGKILDFDETSTLDEKNIVSLAGGSLGGKGRGLAFINTLIHNLDFPGINGRINISAPMTVIIGTNEFQHFLVRNKLFDKTVDHTVPFNEVRRLFTEAPLSTALMKKLKIFVSQTDKPIAVRSSSTSEDSITQPFAGIFDTYMVPNSTKNKKAVVEQVATAIKLVYASTFSDKARNYFSVINHKTDEEKMAVVLQVMVGDRYGDYYYPHISGVAKSFNYYPIAHMQPDEGFAVAAVGLGTYVVDGWQSFRFSPKYPKTAMMGLKELLKSSQVEFFALKCKDLKADLLKDGELATLELLDIAEAEKHGTLTHCASVYNPVNDRIEAGLAANGPRVIDFANILQYDYIPLAETIKILLETIKEAFGSPVEIEYAVDLNPANNGLPTFYLLQIKPLIANNAENNAPITIEDPSKVVLYTQSSMGNGVITGIRDVIFADPQRFDRLKTKEMASEIEDLNKTMGRQKKQYILIGPGRWGSNDRFVGIPVNWSQISNAKVIVEVSLENYPLDSSLGSHFFHNVTSMNIGYLSVQHASETDYLRWDCLSSQEVVCETRYFRHVRFRDNLTIRMDGRRLTAAILHE